MTDKQAPADDERKADERKAEDMSGYADGEQDAEGVQTWRGFRVFVWRPVIEADGDEDDPDRLAPGDEVLITSGTDLDDEVGRVTKLLKSGRILVLVNGEFKAIKPENLMKTHTGAEQMEFEDEGPDQQIDDEKCEHCMRPRSESTRLKFCQGCRLVYCKSLKPLSTCALFSAVLMVMVLLPSLPAAGRLFEELPKRQLEIP